MIDGPVGYEQATQHMSPTQMEEMMLSTSWSFLRPQLRQILF